MIIPRHSCHFYILSANEMKRKTRERKKGEHAMSYVMQHICQSIECKLESEVEIQFVMLRKSLSTE